MRNATAAALVSFVVQGCTPDPAQDKVLPEPIVFSSNRSGRFQLYTCAEDGSRVRLLVASETDDTNPRWSPGGHRLAFIAGTELSLLDLATGLRSSLDVVAEPTIPLSWSPSGDRVVCMAGEKLVAVDVRTRQVSELGKGWLHATWIPGSDLLLATRGQIPFLQVMTGKDEFVRFFLEDGIRNPLIPQLFATWSRTEPPRCAFSSSLGSRGHERLAYDIFVAPIDGTTATKALATEGSDWACDWSPDGKALLAFSDTDGSSDLFVVWIDEARQVNLTNDAALERGASWRP